jgi:hypothetical protein
MADDFWCEAYGPPVADYPVDKWPRCFMAPDGEPWRCQTADICARRLAAERHRVFDKIHAMARDGDEFAVQLAAEFTTPEAMLGGPGEGRTDA